jgi:hypothetical protein
MPSDHRKRPQTEECLQSFGLRQLYHSYSALQPPITEVQVLVGERSASSSDYK